MTCTCESNFTCGHCLSNAPPWHWTSPRTADEAEHDAATLRERVTMLRRLAETANHRSAAILLAEADRLDEDAAS